MINFIKANKPTSLLLQEIEENLMILFILQSKKGNLKKVKKIMKKIEKIIDK